MSLKCEKIKKEPDTDNLNQIEHDLAVDSFFGTSSIKTEVAYERADQSNTVDSSNTTQWMAQNTIKPLSYGVPEVKKESEDCEEWINEWEMVDMTFKEELVAVPVSNNDPDKYKDLAKEPTHITECNSSRSTSMDDKPPILENDNDNKTCPDRHKNFINQKNLSRDMTLNQCNKKYHKCGECDKTFTAASSLRRHEEYHLNLGPYHCEVCHRTFSLERYLLNHLKRKGCDKTRIDRCNKTTDEEPIVCGICNKVFKRKYLLKIHLPTHARKRDTKPFACDHCHRIFKRRSTLMWHMQIHNGLEPSFF